MKVKIMSRCALCTALLCICAWLAVPAGDGYITLQTFGVFLCLGLLGGKWGSLTVLTYLALGAVGLPVFSGFRGGLGALLDVTGGYLTGFLAMALCYWLVTGLFGQRGKVRFLGLVLGLFCCYLLGTLWYWGLYVSAHTGASFFLVAAKCVLPYLIPDGIKLILAFLLTKRLKRVV